MTLPAPRCPRCKTVLSPQWSVCQVCKTRIGSSALPVTPKVTVPQSFTSLLQTGDLCIYREPGTHALKSGVVQSTVITGSRLAVSLMSGITVQGHTIQSIARHGSDGKVIDARSVREGDLLMPIAPASANRTPSTWYLKWQEIATMTVGVLPHESRLKPILSLIDRCTDAYRQGDEAAFERITGQLANFMKASTPRPKPAANGEATATATSA